MAIILFFTLSSGGDYSGTVTYNGEGLKDVSVSDGRNVVKTSEDGTFTLKGYRKTRFITVTVPAGYETEGYYIPAEKGKHEGYDFTLTKSDIAPVEAHSFLQISGTEIGEDGVADISTALSAGQLGLSQQTYDCIDQIQFIAYDGNDQDGYQSSLEQAEEGLREFKANGADISKINIGIAAYGRPVNSTPFWATWRDLPDANYYNSKYYTVADSDQIYEGTFCSPALAGDKTEYALLSGAGGVMVFRVDCDKTMDSPNSVACGIQNALNRHLSDW